MAVAEVAEDHPDAAVNVCAQALLDDACDDDDACEMAAAEEEEEEVS